MVNDEGADLLVEWKGSVWDSDDDIGLDISSRGGELNLLGGSEVGKTKHLGVLTRRSLLQGAEGLGNLLLQLSWLSL